MQSLLFFLNSISESVSTEENTDNFDLNRSTEINTSNTTPETTISSISSLISSTITSTTSNIEQTNQDKVFNEILADQDNAKDEKTSISSEFNQPTMWLGTEDRT